MDINHILNLKQKNEHELMIYIHYISSWYKLHKKISPNVFLKPHILILHKTILPFDCIVLINEYYKDRKHKITKWSWLNSIITRNIIIKECLNFLYHSNIKNKHKLKYYLLWYKKSLTLL